MLIQQINLGNDVCGQMSAWYIFSALGFYPVCPGSDQYVLGAPYLPYLRLTLPNGRAVEVRAKGVSDRRRYVKRLLVNGQPYERLYITHDMLLRGCTLDFENEILDFMEEEINSDPDSERYAYYKTSVQRELRKNPVRYENRKEDPTYFF